MRTPLSLEQLDAVPSRFHGADQAARTAAAYEDLAQRVPAGAEWTAGMALVSAGDCWLEARQQERALECFRQAVESGDEVPPDPRVFLVGGLLRCARHDEADELAGEIRRSKPTDVDVFALVAEAYAAAQRFEDAHRWFTMGLVRCADIASLTGVRLLAGRYRVRRALDLPVDDDDELFAIHVQAARRMLGIQPAPPEALATTYLGRGDDGYDYSLDVVPA